MGILFLISDFDAGCYYMLSESTTSRKNALVLTPERFGIVCKLALRKTRLFGYSFFSALER